MVELTVCANVVAPAFTNDVIVSPALIVVVLVVPAILAPATGEAAAGTPMQEHAVAKLALGRAERLLRAFETVHAVARPFNRRAGGVVAAIYVVFVTVAMTVE